MKTKFIFPIIATGMLICVFFILMFTVPRIMELNGRRQVSEMTPEKAQKLFQDAGGIEEINREAKMLLEKFGTNEDPYLDDETLTNAPAIYSLHTNLVYYSGSRYMAPVLFVSGKYIEIKYGNHWSLKHFYIFDSATPGAVDLATNEFQVTSNIFADK